MWKAQILWTEAALAAQMKQKVMKRLDEVKPWSLAKEATQEFSQAFDPRRRGVEAAGEGPPWGIPLVPKSRCQVWAWPKGYACSEDL